MRPRVVTVTAALTIVAGTTMALTSAGARPGDGGAVRQPALTAESQVRPATPESATPAPPAAPSTQPQPRLAPAKVTVRVDGFLSWALLDRATGRISGSTNLGATSSTESMIKVWLVSDYLRRAVAGGGRPGADRLRQASRAIRDSDDSAAQSLYVAGGGDAVVRRMISTCRLTDTTIYPGWWSRTRISARDAVRLGDCIADGTAAGPRWTGWVLQEMRKVRGTTAARDQPAGGRWGIIDGLPGEIVAQGVGIKNGWTQIGADNSWHVNCLAIGPTWVLAVLMRYPAGQSLDVGAGVCRDVTRQLVTR